jgi:hypothetical protein
MLTQPQDCATAKLDPNNQVANTSKAMLADLVIQLVKNNFFISYDKKLVNKYTLRGFSQFEHNNYVT